MSNVTRGDGLLEKFLAKKRAKQADKCIPGELRTGAILDIGCGTYPFFLINTTFEKKFGVDRIEREEDTVTEDNRQNKITLTDYDVEQAEKLPFQSGYFNAVTMLAVFEHIEPDKLPFLLNEIHRVLSPGGVFVMTTPAKWTDKLLRVMAKLRLVSPQEIEEHKDAYTAKKIKAIVAKTNFHLENVRVGHFELFMNLYAAIGK